MSDKEEQEERKIITWKQLADSQNEHFRHELRMFFNDLELAPKHTDEEYDEVWARLNDCHFEWACLNKLALQYEARMKILIAQADACPVCGTVRRVEELRAKERAK